MTLRIFTALAAALVGTISQDARAREVASLFEPAETLAVGRIEAGRGGEVRNTPQGVVFAGPGGDRASIFVIHPQDSSWDLSAWNHLRIDFKNVGTHLARIVARIDNPNAEAYNNSMVGTAVVPLDQDGTLGVSFTRPGNAYDGPQIFRSQDAMPNGHRVHGRRFDAAKVTAIRLTITAAGPFALRVSPPAAC